MEGKGKLPEGFSERYNRATSSGLVLHETPFEAYLTKIRNRVDALHDKTGISDWLYMDISFCTVLSDCKLYDHIKQKEKELTYETYPNYHDETYADWNFK